MRRLHFEVRFPTSRTFAWSGLACAIALSVAACGNDAKQPHAAPPAATDVSSTPPAAPAEAAPTAATEPVAGPAVPAPTEKVAPVATPLPTEPPRFINAALDQEAMLKVLLEAPVSRFRPVGTSSIVFRASLAADFDAAFKSSSEKRPRAHQAEIASYRLSRLLGLDNVPPAITRRFAADAMRTRMSPSAAWTELRAWIGLDAGYVTGAAIYWIDDIVESGIDTREGTRRYTEWLRHGGTIRDQELGLARDVSNMLAFDCLIGNWDRWSGGNAKGNAARTRVYVRDHDVAFPGRLSEPLMRRMLDRLTPVERFSRLLVQRMRDLTRQQFEAELARDPSPTAILDARQIEGLLDRRDAVLSHIDALIALHGAESVLVFP